MDNKILNNVEKKYNCINCQYECVRKDVMTKHLMTRKHKMLANCNTNGNMTKAVDAETKTYECVCGKIYKFKSGMSRHKLICKEGKKEFENLQVIRNEFILQIIEDNKELKKNNQEFKKLLVEQNKKLDNLTVTNTTTQISNNIQNNTQQNITFNLNYFLNDQCKNAIDMSEFIESLQENFETLENTGKNGIVKSLTQLITKELSKMGVYERPIHCSDNRRKILHIKDNGIWHKDTDDNMRTKQTLRKINHKVNVLQIPKWLHSNPKSENSNHILNDIYLKMIQNSMHLEDETYNKIIHHFSEKFHINKNLM
jgi:hypothetical protein